MLKNARELRGVNKIKTSNAAAPPYPKLALLHINMMLSLTNFNLKIIVLT